MKFTAFIFNVPQLVILCFISRDGFFLQVPGYIQWYNVKFQNDRAICTYELQKDYRNGDVQILIEEISA